MWKLFKLDCFGGCCSFGRKVPNSNGLDSNSYQVPDLRVKIFISVARLFKFSGIGVDKKLRDLFVHRFFKN